MQARLLWFLLPLLGLAAVVGGVAVAEEGARRISADARIERMVVADAVADLEPGTAEELTTALAAFEEEHRRLSIDPVTPDGLDVLADDLTVRPWHDGVFVTTVELDESARVVTIVDDVDPVRAAVLRRWTTIGAIVATFLAIAAAASYPLNRWATRPVRRLHDAAEQLADGAVDVDVEIGRGAPELQEVAQHFDTIAGTLGRAVHRERIFVANASHHLGNLTTPLRLRVESLDGDDDSVHEALTEVGRLEAVVAQLLALNRAEEHELDPVVIDVSTVVDECLHTWRPATEALGIPLHTEVRSDALTSAPPGAIDEVVDNLLDNAVKYGEGAAIDVRVLRGLDHIRLVVTDHGPGMSADELAQAHGRFWRGPQHQNQPGSGLGLSIVDTIARRCGGHVELRSPPDRGLEAMLVLPRVAAV